MVCTNAYTAGVTAMRRTWAMYINGTKRFAFLLDDINPSGSGSIIEYLQTLPSPTSVSSAGLTLTGRQSTVAVTFSGPTNTVASAAGNPSFCAAQSWIYCTMPSIPTNYSTVTNSYTASTSNPMFTFFSPGGTLTASVTSGTGTKTVTLSDGASIVFANGSGSWIVSGTPFAPGGSGSSASRSGVSYGSGVTH